MVSAYEDKLSQRIANVLDHILLKTSVVEQEMSFNAEYIYWIKLTATGYTVIFFVAQIFWKIICKETLNGTINRYIISRSVGNEKVLAEMKTYYTDIIVWSLPPVLFLPISIIEQYYLVYFVISIFVINKFTQGIVLTDKAIYSTSLLRLFRVKKMDLKNIRIWGRGAPLVLTHKYFLYCYTECFNAEEFFDKYMAVVHGGR